MPITDAFPKDDLMMQLYVGHLKNELRKALEPEINRVVDQCVDEAVNSLRVQVHQHYNTMMDERTMKIILEKK